MQRTRAELRTVPVSMPQLLRHSARDDARRAKKARARVINLALWGDDATVAGEVKADVMHRILAADDPTEGWDAAQVAISTWKMLAYAELAWFSDHRLVRGWGNRDSEVKKLLFIRTIGLEGIRVPTNDPPRAMWQMLNSSTLLTQKIVAYLSFEHPKKTCPNCRRKFVSRVSAMWDQIRGTPAEWQSRGIHTVGHFYAPGELMAGPTPGTWTGAPVDADIGASINLWEQFQWCRVCCVCGQEICRRSRCITGVNMAACVACRGDDPLW